jgi:hypothetical protein
MTVAAGLQNAQKRKSLMCSPLHIRLFRYGRGFSLANDQTYKTFFRYFMPDIRCNVFRAKILAERIRKFELASIFADFQTTSAFSLAMAVPFGRKSLPFFNFQYFNGS